MNWFKIYLRPKDCKVIVGDQLSTSRNLDFSVPQGSCAGPVLYLAYASTMQEIIPSLICLCRYADDHALKVSFKANHDDRNEEKSCIAHIENCMDDVKKWMDTNRLKIISSKTKFILFGNSRQLRKCTTESIKVVEDNIDRTHVIKYLGEWLDESLSMEIHSAKKCRTAMMMIQRLKLIRKKSHSRNM